MEIKLSESGAKGSFYISDGDETLAEMTWVKGSDLFIIVDHTMVDEQLKGQGIGRKLLEKVIGLARERNIKILPLCPFVKSVFDKVPEYEDVLYR